MVLDSCLSAGFVLAFDSLSVTFSDLVIIITFVIGLTLYARDVRVGLMLNFLIFGCIFMWFYNAQINYGCNYNWVKPLVMVILHFVLLTLTLFPTTNQPQTGRIV